MPASPTSMTLNRCRADGHIATVAEHWVAFPPPGHRRDLFGFIDVICLRPDGIVAIQATSNPNLSARVKKIGDERRETAQAWLDAGGQIEVWGWYKYKKAEDRKFWRPTIRPITEL